jgi:hypothetical protein
MRCMDVTKTKPTATDDPSKPVGFKLHLLLEVIFALGVTVFHLIMLRGLNLDTLALFGVPPLLAFIFLHSSNLGFRRIALAFLLLVAIGAFLASLPALFPKLGGFDPGLPRQADRLLAWYMATYSVFAIGVVPAWGLISSLICHHEGRPAQISRVTCYLGLATIALLFPVMIVVLIQHLGFWPIA